MTFLDTNALLRYILNDIPEQHSIAEASIIDGATTSIEVFAEIAYVLSGVYKMPRNDISWTLQCLLLDLRVDNVKVLRYAFAVFNQTTLDFVDCIIVAYKKVLGISVLTFDKKLEHVLNKELAIFQS